MSDDLETLVGDLAPKLLRCARDDKGQVDSLVFALAAADVVASNFSLLDPDVAAEAMSMFLARVMEDFAVLQGTAAEPETLN